MGGIDVTAVAKDFHQREGGWMDGWVGLMLLQSRKTSINGEGGWMDGWALVCRGKAICRLKARRHGYMDGVSFFFLTNKKQTFS